MTVLPVCMFVSYVYVWYLRGLEEGVVPGTGVTDVCELMCGFWELNLGPLEEQPVVLNC